MTTLTANQKRVLQILAQATTPLKSREIMTRAGLFISEFRSTSVVLRANQFITCKVKFRKQQIGGSRALKPLAFWSITDKGRDSVSAKT